MTILLSEWILNHEPRTIPTEWTDNGGDPTQILSEIGDLIPIEENHMKLMTKITHSDLSDDAISEESDYEKQNAKRAQ